jgi:hypothetical protein
VVQFFLEQQFIPAAEQFFAQQLFALAMEQFVSLAVEQFRA